jgi:hypothetical protein
LSKEKVKEKLMEKHDTRLKRRIIKWLERVQKVPQVFEIHKFHRVMEAAN